MLGRADIEGYKSNVAMNAWLPQASYPGGNYRVMPGLACGTGISIYRVIPNPAVFASTDTAASMTLYHSVGAQCILRSLTSARVEIPCGVAEACSAAAEPQGRMC